MTIFTSVLFWQFVVLNFINVLVNTARSLCTIKGGKWVASIMNSICYGYYTVIIVITATYEMPLLIKCFAVAFVNFVGVFTIKFCEEKLQKDKKWIFLATAQLNTKKLCELLDELKDSNIKYVFNEVVRNELYTIQIFSKNRFDSEHIVNLMEIYGIKYSAVEDKI